MATWEDVGTSVLDDAIYLYDATRHRSAVSRFYYAVFAALTGELIRRNAAPDFNQGRQTPSHAQVADLIDVYFTHFSSERANNLKQAIRALYRDRILADYSTLRVDRIMAREAYRLAKNAFRYLEVKS